MRQASIKTYNWTKSAFQRTRCDERKAKRSLFQSITAVEQDSAQMRLIIYEPLKVRACQKLHRAAALG